MRLLVSACLLAVSAAPSIGAAQEARQGPPPWSFGLMTIVRDTPYAQADNDTLVVPLIQYEGERAYFRGLSLGWRLQQEGPVQVDLIARARLDGFEAKDSPVFEGMATRQRSVEVGASASTALGPGRIEFAAFTDAMARSGGQELDLMWRGDFRRGPLRLQPEAGLRWQSSDLVDYYFGVRPEEAIAGRPAYRAGSALVPRLALSGLMPLSGNWSVFARLSVDRLPSSIEDSPLVDRASERRAFIGLLRSF
jgi:outer membrane protein